jgi:hypothetical protein
VIFHNHKLVFLHPGKTGGTSIESSLAKKYLNTTLNLLDAKNPNYDLMYGFCKNAKIYLHHADLRFYNLHKIEIPKNYIKLVSIRCPYHKILSAYYYNLIDKHISFKDFVTNRLENLLLKNKDYARNHFCPQVYYYSNNFNIIRLESINEDCLKFDINLGKNFSAKTKASKEYKDYLEAYDSKTINIVNELYKEDFLTFDYRKVNK